MRTENSLRNSIFGVLRIMVKLVLSFVVRTIFIKVLGEEFLGLDSLFTSILSVLSLAELGFGSAIVYSMYKPIAEKNDGKIAALLAIYKKTYFIIGLLVLLIGLAITPFLKYFINGNIPTTINIYIVFIVFLVNTVSGYFFAYKRSLLYANQRSDIENKIGTLFIILLNVVQIVLLLLIKNYYFYILVIPIITILENIVISLVVNKMYPNLGKSIELSYEEKKTLKKNTIAMLGHRIGGVAVCSTDNILMSAFLGLAVVGLYNNYFLIISSISSFIVICTKSLGASIGNSIVEENSNKNFNNFICLSFLNFWILGFCSICLLVLLQPFMDLWLGKSYFLNDDIVFCMIINFAFNQSRGIINIYKETTGTFYNDRYKPIIEAVVNLVASIILVKYFGLIGIIMGTTISTVFVAIPIEAYVVFKNYFHRSLAKYFLQSIIYFFVIAVVMALTYFVCALLPSSGILYFMLKMLICFVLPNLIFFLCSFWTPQFKYFSSLFKSIVKKIFKRKAKENKR